jgi:UDP-glucose:(heptosyl)LPS alpha-1,3-glucosyltransferase
MRVALVMERIETWRGGAETSTMQFADHLAAAGVDLTVLTATVVQSTPRLRIVPLHVSSTLRASKTRAFARRVTQYIREHSTEYDIVHGITPCAALDVYQPRGGTVPETLARNVAIRRAAVQKGFKRLTQALSWKYRVIARLERDLIQRDPPPCVIAISGYVADQLRRHYGLDDANIRLIFNGVDPDTSSPDERREHRLAIRKQFGLADDDVVALCVAHNFKLKGVGKLVEAMAKVNGARGDGGPSGSRRRVYAIVVGRDDLTPYLRQLQSLGIADTVLFSGPTQRIAAFFHAADFLVHPTYYDPCSRVVLEAMSAGLPVITTRFNGAAERVRDGQEGYVIDAPEDVDALADRMRLLEDATRRREMGAAALQAVADLTMQRHADEVLKLYHDLLRRGPRHGRGYR